MHILKRDDGAEYYSTLSEAELRALVDDFGAYCDEALEALQGDDWGTFMIERVRGAVLCMRELSDSDNFIADAVFKFVEDKLRWTILLQEGIGSWHDELVFGVEAEGVDSTPVRKLWWSDLDAAEATLYRVQVRIAARQGEDLPNEDPSRFGNLFARLARAKREYNSEAGSVPTMADSEPHIFAHQQLKKWGPGGDKIDRRTFLKIQQAAGVSPSAAGHHGQTRLFTPSELRAMIGAVNENDHIQRREARDHWRRLLAEWETEQRAK